MKLLITIITILFSTLSFSQLSTLESGHLSEWTASTDMNIQNNDIEQGCYVMSSGTYNYSLTKEVVNLDNYNGETNVIINIVGKNGNGPSSQGGHWTFTDFKLETSTDSINWTVVDDNPNVTETGVVTYNEVNIDFLFDNIDEAKYVKVTFEITTISPGSVTMEYSNYTIDTDTTSTTGNGSGNPTSTGIEDNIIENLNIYSYNDMISVDYEDYNDYTVSILNLNGQTIYKEVTNGSFNYTVENTGIYLVHFKSENKETVKKVVIQ